MCAERGAMARRRWRDGRGKERGEERERKKEETVVEVNVEDELGVVVVVVC